MDNVFDPQIIYTVRPDQLPHTSCPTLMPAQQATFLPRYRLSITWSRHPRSTRLGISLIANALRSYVYLSTDSRKHLHWAASLSICMGNNLAGAISEVHTP